MITLCLLFLNFQAGAESFRALVAGTVEVSVDNPAGSSITLGINNSAFITLGAETRFFRGIELELSAPQRWLPYRGSLAMVVYAELSRQSTAGIADLDGRRIAFEPLPGKLQMIYQIPLRSAHGLRTTPYVTVPAGIIRPASFPILFRIMPVIKGLSEELETMVFQLNAKPILSDEGAVKLSPRYPEQLRGKPFTVLIDDVLIENLAEEQLLKEGEHHLVILSDDYRNESRRFLVEHAKILDLVIELQDPTPLIIFEGPENARIFLNNELVSRPREPIPVEPGQHEAKFQVGDYTIIRTLNIQRGKTYRIVLAVDINVLESE
ncbi:hypothetical protein AGMMS50293_18180 [Spirochaetia bacterium]|nr:hypothetical protein AGMMS50293_18180 [Spirochaetia bacterium]